MLKKTWKNGKLVHKSLSKHHRPGTLDQNGLLLIEESWKSLSAREISTLHDIFLTDGHKSKAYLGERCICGDQKSL